MATFVSAILTTIVDMRTGPSELSFANGLITTRADLHRHLGDSNIDWGQGLKSLKNDLVARGDPVIFLSYFGTARPEAYGIRYQRLPTWGQFHKAPADQVDVSGPIIVAVSVTNLQGIYLRDPAAYEWLFDRVPTSRTDGSIWLWDLTGDPEAIERLRTLATRQASEAQ